MGIGWMPDSPAELFYPSGSGRTAVGRAPAAWTVQVAGVNASRNGEIYYRDLTATNTSVPVWQSVITKRDTGTPTTTNNFWYAKTPTVPTYDDDGNLTNDGRWVYTWDAENRLIQMETTSQATTAGHPYTKLKFVYDWQGRRIARTVWKGGTQASPTFASNRRWLYDGWNVIAEFSATSETTTTVTRLNTFTWGLDLSGTLQGAGGVGGLLVQTTVSGGVMERASYDGNGNIVAWTKSTATAPTSRREYDAFGNTLVSEGTTPCSFGFSTKMQDAETGLYYYGYRYYDTVNGRWLNRDPIGEMGGVNLYGFVENNGTNGIDLVGLADIEIRLKRLRSNSVETTGKFVARSSSGGIQQCCHDVEGETAEVPSSGVDIPASRGLPARHDNPLSEGSHPLQINDPEHTGTKQFTDKINAEMSPHDWPVFPLPVREDWSEKDYNRNFNVSGGQVCIHYGHDADWSDLCIIVGRNGKIDPTNTNGRDHPGAPAGTGVQTTFHPNDSSQVMIDLLDLYDCVKKKLGHRPSMTLIVEEIK